MRNDVNVYVDILKDDISHFFPEKQRTNCYY